jgi:hypothetical protein
MASVVYTLVRNQALSWKRSTSNTFPVRRTQQSQAFRLHSVSIQQATVHCCLLGNKFTAVQVPPLHGLLYSASLPASAFLTHCNHHHTALTSTVASPDTLSKRSWMLVGLSPSATKTSITTQRFNGTSLSIILEPNVVLPSIQWNTLDQQNTTDNVQELHKCSGYSHEQRM